MTGGGKGAGLCTGVDRALSKVCAFDRRVCQSAELIVGDDVFVHFTGSNARRRYREKYQAMSVYCSSEGQEIGTGPAQHSAFATRHPLFVCHRLT